MVLSEATLSGALDAACLSVVDAKKIFDSGKGRVLATTLPYPHPDFPNVPTVESLGFKGVPRGNWIVLMAAAASDSKEVDRIAEAFRSVIARPEVFSRLKQASMDPIRPEDATPEIARRFIRQQLHSIEAV